MFTFLFTDRQSVTDMASPTTALQMFSVPSLAAERQNRLHKEDKENTAPLYLYRRSDVPGRAYIPTHLPLNILRLIKLVSLLVSYMLEMIESRNGLGMRNNISSISPQVIAFE